MIFEGKPTSPPEWIDWFEPISLGNEFFCDLRGFHSMNHPEYRFHPCNQVFNQFSRNPVTFTWRIVLRIAPIPSPRWKNWCMYRYLMIKCSAKKNSNFRFSIFFFHLLTIFCDEIAKFSSGPLFYFGRSEKSTKQDQMNILNFFSTTNLI